MGLGEEDTNARARRHAPKGVADVGDTLLGNFLQGVSNVARDESDKKQSSSRVRKNGESRPNREKTEHRQKGKEKRRRSRERPEAAQTGSDRLQSKEKHKKKESKHAKTSREKKTTVNGHVARENAAANQKPGSDKPPQKVAPGVQTRNGGAANGCKAESTEGKASRHRDRKRRRKQEEEAKDDKFGHAKNGQGPKDTPSLSVEAAAITDDTADDILGSFLRKLLGGTGQVEPEKAPSTASAAAAGTSTSTPSRLSPSVPVSTTLPEIGDLLGGLEVEREPSLVATESGSESVDHCLPVGHTISTESGRADEGKQEVVQTQATQVASSLEVSAPPVGSSTVPAATVAHREVAIAPGHAVESEDSSDSYSSSSSSIASLRRRAQLVGSSPAPKASAAPQPRSLQSDSSSSSSSSSGASSESHFSELFPGESVTKTDGVLTERNPGRVERFACAKMSVRSKLRCSCHFALLKSCPDKGGEVIGDEFCGSDE